MIPDKRSEVKKKSITAIELDSQLFDKVPPKRLTFKGSLAVPLTHIKKCFIEERHLSRPSKKGYSHSYFQIRQQP